MVPYHMHVKGKGSVCKMTALGAETMKHLQIYIGTHFLINYQL
jgi:hypothetical protein